MATTERMVGAFEYTLGQIRDSGQIDLSTYHLELGKLFQKRHQNQPNLRDLNNTVLHLQTGVNLSVSTDYQEMIFHWQNLADCYLKRYTELDVAADIESAVQCFQAMIDIIPDVDSHNKAAGCVMLAKALKKQFQKTKNLDDLDLRIQTMNVANDLISAHDPLTKVTCLSQLGSCYSDRYHQLEDIHDLEAALTYENAAAGLLPDDHAEKPRSWNILGARYHTRYQQSEDPEDLQTALQCLQRALELTPLAHPDRARWIHDLAVAHNSRFESLNQREDNDLALKLHHASIDLTADDDPKKASGLLALGNAYHARYMHFGELKDLEKAFKFRNQAMGNVADSPDPEHLHNLGVTYQLRYSRLGNVADLDLALTYLQQAVEATADGFQAKTMYLKNLGMAYLARHRRTLAVDDLELALKFTYAAKQCIPDGSVQQADVLRTLSSLHSLQYQFSQDNHDAEVALKYALGSLSLTPKDHPQHVTQLFEISRNYSTVFEYTGELVNLEKALSYGRDAVEHIPNGHLHKAMGMMELGSLYITRYQQLKQQVDMDEAVKWFSTSLQGPYDDPVAAWNKLRDWAEFTFEEQPLYAIPAIQAAFRILAEPLWIGHPLPVRHEAIKRLDIPSALSFAFKCCLSMSESNDDLADIIEILEQGMGTVYQQMQQLKLEDIELPAEHAKEFQELSRSLYTLESEPSMELFNQRESILHSIRAHTGFEKFLLPRTYLQLREAVQGGPVVILSSHPSNCHALVLFPSKKAPIELQFFGATNTSLRSRRLWLKHHHLGRQLRQVHHERLAGRREAVDANGSAPSLKDLLQWLWENVVSGVYESLRRGGRLWWLTTGEFSGLPVHACVPLDQNDRFIHSYTSTLSALCEGYAAGHRRDTAQSRLSLVGVSRTGAHLRNHLPGVEDEMRNISAVVPSGLITSLHNAQATPQAVSSEIQTSSWLHLACHGKQDLVNPTKTHLVLHGGNLELETILRMPLSNAQVVFLAACETAMGDSQLVNESFHLSGGLIAAGFRGAVGTLWAIDDRDGPLVAKWFYEQVFRNGEERDMPKAEDAAEALNFAIRELRKTGVSEERWAAFVHLGV
ncbi:CHAT domain-containing protein [Mycena amicta]|nr:CHAT domain-containing protein [Mycena amicta]